jgi:hypothetical protein
MRRYVSVKRAASGTFTTVTVSLIDGDLSARWSVKTYIGNVGAATANADTYARRALEEIRVQLDAAEAAGDDTTEGDTPAPVVLADARPRLAK